ncbi:MAG: lactonase family protein [Bacteroidota bacterium]
MHNSAFVRRFGARLLIAGMFLFALLAGYTAPAFAATEPAGYVYTTTNAPGGNAVLAYLRAEDGTLSFQGSYATGGLGTGAGLGSQGALVVSQNHHWLFAVNAGSNSVSAFMITDAGLVLTDTESSGGMMPVSVASYQNLVYVVNAGGSGNIAGFMVASNGDLSPIAGSVQPASNGGVGAAPGLAQISFTPDGAALVVTEKATNLIDTYLLTNGAAGAPVTHPSAGMTPFGFAFNKRGILVVSEAFGGAPGGSALSSYAVSGNNVTLVSPSVWTTQTAACWVAIPRNGKFAYTTNAGSASISSYRIARNGSLTLMNPVAGVTGAGAVDMAFSGSSSFLYALGSAGHTISMFAMQAGGSLAALGSIGVPAGVAGLAAY